MFGIIFKFSILFNFVLFKTRGVEKIKFGLIL